MKAFAARQIKTLRDTLKDKADNKIVIVLFIFLLLNVIKITFFNYFIMPNQSFETLKYKFEFTLLLALMIYPLIYKIKTRVVFIILYILQIIYIVVNISYYQYFHNYIHFNQFFSLFTEGLTAAGHSSAPVSPQLLIVFLDLPLFIFVVMKYLKAFEVMKKLKFFVTVISVAALCIVFAMEINNFNNNCSFLQYMQDNYTGESPIVERYGTFIDNVISTCLNGSDEKLIESLRYGKEQSNTDESENKPNFIIVQVESMDANVINKQYKGNYIAPYLHSLTNSSIFYPYVLSYHMGGGTSDVEFSIINSAQPLTSFPAMKLSNYNYPNSMIKKLTNQSYQALAFHGNGGNFFNRDVAFPKMAFKQFYDMNKMNLKNVGWGAPDKDVLNYTIDTLKTLKQPFISYTITMTSHGPFTNVRNYYNNNLYNGMNNENVSNYFDSMSYVDQSLKEFVTKVKANFKNTYILIWGDHTPNIRTDEYQQASFTEGDKYFEFVPLFIITPDNKTYKEDKQVASFLDISPTILYTSGVKFDVKSDGVNLLKTPETDRKIPLKGVDFDRTQLYNKISSQK
ncbi:MAG: LTA synthase family protein [Bacillota bacterium]|nr:LTA synthase family protein [Bacillota bacterium]